MRGGGLEWSNQPIPYKIYTTLPALPLPAEGPATTLPALDAIRRRADPAGSAPAPDLTPALTDLAQLCRLSNGITRRRRTGGREQAFRAAGTTGALYHVELYLVAGDLPGLEAGVYHYGAHDDSLRQLRARDHRSVLVEASGHEPAISHAPVVIVATSTYWRNAWKYEARAYRHSFWDTGTILANLLALATALGIPARVVLGWADEPVSRLLGVDPDREGVVALVALGREEGEAQSPRARLEPTDLEPLDLPTAALSPREVYYEEIAQAHRAGFLASGAEAKAWREAAERRSSVDRESGAPLIPLALDQAQPAEPIESVIRRRGSSRQFSHRPIGFGALSAILEAGLAPIPSDCTADGPALGQPLLIVNAVDGLEPGLYAAHRDPPGLEPLRLGAFRREAGVLALGQDLGGDAAVNAYFLSDLDPILDALGDRGYRAAQLTCAIAAGRMWLAAYALRLGATGLTFFDDPVVELFSPRAAGMDVMFLLAVGQPA
jgi:SagB-type dehydrogenase family enzyme